MQFIKKFIISKNVWTVGIGIFSIWFVIFGATTMFKSPETTEKIFIYILKILIFSFLGASLIITLVSKIIKLQSLLKNLDIDASWILILALGSFFFMSQFAYPHLFSFEGFLGIFLLSFVPAGLFRVLVNFVESIRNKSEFNPIHFENKDYL